MAEKWAALVLQGWDEVKAAMHASNSKEKLDHANRSLSFFEAAHEASGQDPPFEALIGKVHACCHLADLETKAKSSGALAQAAVASAESLLELWQKQNPEMTVSEELLRIKDAYGCALRQRYVYVGDRNDCNRAIELHRACVEHTFPSNELKAAWNYNLSLALITLVRDDTTIKRMPEIFLAFTTGYKALELSNWSKPLYIVTLCSFRIFIVLETKHHSIDHNTYDNAPNREDPSAFDIAALLHTMGIYGAQEWLERAKALNPNPYVATMIRLVAYITKLLDDNDDTSVFVQRVEDVRQLLFEQQYEFDRRHAPYLLDLLGALVRCRRLGLHYADLIESLGQLLLNNLLGATGNNSRASIQVNPAMHHFELSRLLYLIGESHYLRVSELKVHGHRDLDYLPAVIHQRAALRLTPDGHPRQLLYLLSLAFALAGSAQNTSVQNDDDMEEFLTWIQLISTLQMDDADSVARDLSRGDEFEKLELLLSSLPLESFENVAEWALGYFLQRFDGASRKSEQHRVAGIGFANLSMRLAMSIVTSGKDNYTEISYGHIYRASEMWEDLCLCYPDVSSIAFGHGAALSIKADHVHILKENIEGACIMYGTSIDYMQQSLSTSSPSTILDIQQSQLLADTLFKRYRLSIALNWKVHDDVEQAISLLRGSVHASIRENMPATVTHSIAKDWSKRAVEFQHPSILEAYQTQIDAFIHLAWVGFDFRNQLKTLQSAGQALAADASTCAMRVGDPELAIEMLESCRTVLLLSAVSTWNIPLDIRVSHKELVLRMEKLGRKIRNLSSSYSEASNADSGNFTTFNDQKSHLAQRLRQLGIKWDRAVSEVRAIPKHEEFMRTMPYDRLASAVSDKLSVSVVTSDEYDCCHALLLIWGEPYILPLPLTPKKASQIFNQFKAVLKFRFGRGNSNDDSRDMEDEVEETRIMERLNQLQVNPAFLMADILKDLWDLVMQLVIDFIKVKIGQQHIQTGSLPHIWMNSTGHLSSLPLHAAGVYDKDGRPVNGQSVLDHVICSSNPSLASLRAKTTSPTIPTKVLALGAGENLKHVQEEVGKVYEIFGQKGDVTKLVGKEFNLDNVKKMLPELQIVHFASHGIQDANNPLNSRLLFHSKSELTLEELMKLYLPEARLAVLFACETAQGDSKLTNEALHLVGAMLGVGFSGAIGTLWPMADSDGIPVCEVFYKTLLEGEGSEIDYSRTGLALHKAVCALRDDGAGLLRWATFAHFGQ